VFFVIVQHLFHSLPEEAPQGTVPAGAPPPASGGPAQSSGMARTALPPDGGSHEA
jgi:hypothetical protein